jgi:hypothetical protein
MSSLSAVEQNPSDYIDNCNIHDPSLYQKEYSSLKGCVIVCLSKVEESSFSKIDSLAKDTGKRTL